MATTILAQSINGLTVGMRSTDGYVNATALSTAHKAKTGKRKDVADWLGLKRTVESLEHLSSVTAVPVTELYQVFQGGTPENQGTWIHPSLEKLFRDWLNKSNNKKPDYLYVIGDKTRSVCKIGISSNPYQRLCGLQCGYPWNLDILMSVSLENAASVEKLLHKRFSDFKLNGEWFDLEVLRLIDVTEFMPQYLEKKV